MARVTIADLQSEIEELRRMLAAEQQANRELRAEINGVRMIVSVASNTLERALR